MICLGIESTAHTFGCGVVSDKGSRCSILANEKAAYATEEGGIHPIEAANHHLEKGKGVIDSALEKAGVGWKEIDLVAFSQGPGIGNALRVGAVAARALGLKHNIPVLGVNHCVAHIEIGKALTKARDPIVVYASGANTQIVGFETGRYRIYGETLDIGIGNLLDVFARALGIGFPGGPVLDKMYFEPHKYVPLPYTVKGMDLAFSGLLTAAEQKVGKLAEGDLAQKVGKISDADLAYSLMHTGFAMLAEVAERALAHTEKREILLTGGVAASKALQEMMGKMCRARGAKMFVPPAEACVDSGLLPAWLGLVEYRSGVRMYLNETTVNPKQRIDQIEISWS